MIWVVCTNLFFPLKKKKINDGVLYCSHDAITRTTIFMYVEVIKSADMPSSSFATRTVDAHVRSAIKFHRKLFKIFVTRIKSSAYNSWFLQPFNLWRFNDSSWDSNAKSLPLLLLFLWANDRGLKSRVDYFKLKFMQINEKIWREKWLGNVRDTAEKFPFIYFVR